MGLEAPSAEGESARAHSQRQERDRVRTASAGPTRPVGLSTLECLATVWRLLLLPSPEEGESQGEGLGLVRRLRPDRGVLFETRGLIGGLPHPRMVLHLLLTS